MKQNVTLTIASLLSILFMTFHTADDIVRGMEPGTLYVIILLGSLLGLLVPVIHMKGAGVGGAIAKSNGAFFFIWTLLALGVTALFSVILSARGLWEHLPWRTTAQHKQGTPA
jgi:hypothetical protein